MFISKATGHDDIGSTRALRLKLLLNFYAKKLKQLDREKGEIKKELKTIPTQQEHDAVYYNIKEKLEAINKQQQLIEKKICLLLLEISELEAKSILATLLIVKNIADNINLLKKKYDNNNIELRRELGKLFIEAKEYNKNLFNETQLLINRAKSLHFKENENYEEWLLILESTLQITAKQTAITDEISCLLNKQGVIEKNSTINLDKIGNKTIQIIYDHIFLCELANNMIEFFYQVEDFLESTQYVDETYKIVKEQGDIKDFKRTIDLLSTYNKLITAHIEKQQMELTSKKQKPRQT